jgi:hypothetical protein
LEIMKDSFAVWAAIGADVATVAMLGLVLWQIRRMTAANNLSVVIHIFEQISDPIFKEHQDYLINKFAVAQAKSPARYWALPDEERKHVDPVCSTFDLLGLLVASGTINKDIAISFAGGPAERAWRAVRTCIELERAWRKDQPGGSGLYREYFEHFADLAAQTPQREIMERWNVRSTSIS